jgi:hypothetical protein
MSNALDRLDGAIASRPQIGSQAAAVEHTRAAAEVAAAVQAARMVPRDVNYAKAKMREACADYGLANRAFYAYPKGNEEVTGPTVHLARELAAIYGNVDYGTAELARRGDESEIRAWAWDQETNTRKSRTMIVPHIQYIGRGKRALGDMRDIDQNNNSVAGRAEREMLFAILPNSFVEEAKRLCRDTLERGNGQSVEDRAAAAVALFGRGGVTPAQLEARIGKPIGRWSAQNVADLDILFESLKRREITKDEAFPPAAGVSAGDIVGKRPASDPADVDPTTDPNWGQGQ